MQVYILFLPRLVSPAIVPALTSHLVLCLTMSMKDRYLNSPLPFTTVLSRVESPEFVFLTFYTTSLHDSEPNQSRFLVVLESPIRTTLMVHHLYTLEGSVIDSSVIQDTS
ncbi:hypothetical protein BDP27DRAFT_1328684 [Rhodocollybia butyracea]|uniref:Uncharacterized protein n=1 Tax=Rhodocollybia butyracea TaxID=206335 RepID=A0A9P5PT49_9AGAR|nr:hypothetical protein BDP27DRAFT_1328684 [Rhodocollybia butyracea]